MQNSFNNCGGPMGQRLTSNSPDTGVGIGLGNPTDVWTCTLYFGGFVNGCWVGSYNCTDGIHHSVINYNCGTMHIYNKD